MASGTPPPRRGSKPLGRPQQTGANVTVRLTPQLQQRVEAWAAERELTRAQAIRLLLAAGLDGAGG